MCVVWISGWPVSPRRATPICAIGGIIHFFHVRSRSEFDKKTAEIKKIKDLPVDVVNITNVSDIKGNVKLFYTSGSVNLTGKQKRRRVIAVLRLFKLLYKHAYFLYGKPIALHLNNVNRHKFLIIRKLKQKFFIKLIREFNQIPYNGCRKPKIRRKKYKKKLIW